MNFDFATSQRILFGRGRLSSLGELARAFGTRVFLIAGEHLRRSAALEAARASLRAKGVAMDERFVHGEPDVGTVDALVADALSWRAEVVVGLGGGSVLDTGKAVASLVTNGGPVRDYLEGVGTGRAIEKPSLPYLAVPTTAGTGSEVTRNAVIASKAEGFKKSLRSALLLPAVALVDPSLTDSTPPRTTVGSGLDALTQLIEPFVCARPTPMTDALALDGVRRASAALPRVAREPSDTSARDEMAYASLLGGLCLANAGLGAVHGIDSALGAHSDIPHGFACACVLVQATAANIRALEERAPDSPVLDRYARLGELLAGTRFSSGQDARRGLVARLRQLAEELQVPGLSDFGLRAEQLPRLVADSRGSSMKANPIVLSDVEIEAVLRASL